MLMLTTLNAVMWGSVWEHLRIALVMSSVTLWEIAVMTSTAHVIEVSERRTDRMLCHQN